MRSAMHAEPLGRSDTAWLRMEEPNNLMVINSILTFDRPLSEERVLALTGERLLAFERFRERVVSPLVGRPRWQRDPNFHLRRHVHHIALPAPGDRRALEALVSDLMSVPLDLSMPPWQVYLVDGVEAGSALVVRLHHCIADGFALMRVLLSLTDGELNPPTEEAHGSNGPGATRSPGGDGHRNLSERVLDAAKLGAGGLLAIGRIAILPPDPPSPFKGSLGVLKRAAWSEAIPLSEVKGLGHRAGATINDVLISTLSGALRRYLDTHGAHLAGRDLHVIVPVNLRPPDEPVRLGNDFGLVFMGLPVSVADPVDRLAETHRRMDALKHSPEAMAAFTVLEVIGSTTPGLEGLAVRFFGTKATAIATNVPGPRERRFFGGEPIRSIMFFVPQSARVGIGISLFSYAGEVRVGIAGDVGLVPDPGAIVDGFYADLAALEKALA